MQNLIIWEPFDYIELFILWALPLFYKLSFWLYTIQLKEYRWDRFKEYITTKQWRDALFSIFSVVELMLFIISILIWIPYFIKTPYLVTFWWTFYWIFIWFLVIENIFVLWKIFRKKIIKPIITWRLVILLLLFIIWASIDLYYFYSWNLWSFSYLYILGVYLGLPLIIFFYNIISLPLVNYKKNKQIKKAIEKSKKINTSIKIWITWSYGKSSVKEFLSSILEQDWSILKTPENQNTEMSVSALILNKLSNKYKYFVAEMWAYRIWEISLLWKIVNHKYWFLTAIWNQHIWLFWNQENIIKAKFEILEKVKENNWFLYVNNDNKFIEKYLENINTTNIIRYWVKSEKACAKSKIIEINDLKTKFEFSYNWLRETFETNLIWEHNILNITWILAFCYDIWLETKDLKKYLLNIKKPKNTQEIIKIWKNILIDDTYNLSEAWLKSGLDLLKYFKNKNKILVLDDILELWKESEKIHYNIAKQISKNKLIDKILFIWVNYKDSFKKGLIDGWLKKENILINLENIDNNTVILFEWRKSKKFFNRTKKNYGT